MNTPTTLRRTLLATYLALALAATLSACGGGSGSTGTQVSGGTSAPPSANFKLVLSASQAVVLQGDSAAITATLTRLNGYTGAVDLSITGLPAGVSAAGTRIAPGSDSVTLTFNAAATAAHSLPTPVSVSATAGALRTTQQLTVTVRGAAGALDTSFGSAGKALSAVGPTDDYAQALAVQSDGKLVVAGWGNGSLGYAFEVVRFLRDGSIDASFGSAGKVIATVGNGAHQANAVAVQADGKILVAGSVSEPGKGKSFALARFNADGSADVSFGHAGKVVTSLGSDSDEAFAMVLQPDGRIVLGGHTRVVQGGALQFALARYNADGTLDGSFGSAGKTVATVRANSGRDSIYALAIQTVDGEPRIVAAGGEGDFVVARFNPNGTLDASFAGNGHLDGAFGTVIGAARALSITSDNQLVIAGHADHQFAVLKLATNGSAVAEFGSNGRTRTAVNPTNWSEAQAVVVQGDGKIVLGGWAYAGNGSSGDHVVARYTAAGTLDGNFGTGGLTITAVAPGTKGDEGRAMVLQADERVPAVRSVLAGSANDADQDFVLTRYWH